MKIAITSQNVRSVTAHAGRCRKFWVYDIAKVGSEIKKRFVELENNESLHSMKDQLPEKLSGLNVLITVNLGASLRSKLSAAGVVAHLTDESSPDYALLKFLASKSISN
jgi:predicted Fe-Mo cluster-binding NifX family protein